jgi:voltage-gated potassium channel
VTEPAGDDPSQPQLARTASRRSPTVAILVRFATAIGLVLINWLLVVVESGGYTDNADGHVSVSDALYYTTVTLTTTGYGDITPVTTTARLVNALLVTPMRLIFVVLLVGTTIKALTRQSRNEFRLARWRKRMKDHVVVLGYGTKGRNAARALVEQGTPPSSIVVVDRVPEVVADAARAGFTGVRGAATDEHALRQALIDRARVAIVALGRDDTAILATLTIRRLAPGVEVIATAREAQNAELLEQSGARSVIVSSETAGRLLGLATNSPETVEVVEDLLSFGEGLDLRQRVAAAEEVGRALNTLPIPVLAVLRSGRILHYNDPDAQTVRAGDHLVYAHA